MDTKPKRGLRSFYPTDKGPIDLYQLGHDGRIEYVAAQISTDHLTKGVGTTDEWRNWAKERGAPTDEPGLIVSKRLGGSGIDAINLFPKSPLLDKTSWATDEEKAYKEASEMKKWKKMKFFVKFEYPSQDSLRPSDIEYQYDLPSGNKLHGKVVSEVSEGSTTPATEEKVVPEDEDEGSEYEYEYEEEASPEPEETLPTPTIQQKPEELSQKIKETPIVVDTEAPKAKPEVPTVPSQQPPTAAPRKRSPSPTPVVLPPTPVVVKTDPKIPTPPSIPDTPQPQTTVIQAVSSSTQDEKLNNLRLLARSDFIEMLPILGSVKLALDAVKALSKKDTQRTLWKGIQCGISVFADFHFIRAFVRHGEILVKPITEKKLVTFANKVEPHLIIFVVCKAGNQVLSVIRRVLSNKKT